MICMARVLHRRATSAVAVELHEMTKAAKELKEIIRSASLETA
jgi:hypothetical protein